MQPHPRAATVVESFTHRLHIGLDLLIDFWVASDHERESAALGARFRTGAGYVQVMDALLRQGRSDLTALTWGYSAGVGDHSSGLCSFHDAVLAEDDFFGHLGVADAQKDAVGCGANLLGSLAEVTFFGFG